MYETLVKRTIWVAECGQCQYRDVVESNPPKERLCPDCNAAGGVSWISYKEQSYTGPSLTR